MLGTTFRTYVEAVPGVQAGTIGSHSTGIAVANASSSPGTVTLDLFTADGNATAFTATQPVPGNGQFQGYLSDFFPTLTLPFQGVLRVRANTAGMTISVVALRVRYNQRGELLITTTPPTEENGNPVTAEFDFPDFVNGSGQWTTQFILFSGLKGQATSGNLQFYSSGGSALPLTVNSTIAAAPVVLTSVSPTTAAQGASVTLTGTGFTSASTVVFTTSSGTATVTPSAQTSTSLTAAVPGNGITGPVFVQNGASSSSTVILQVTALSGAQIQTALSVGAGATVQGADIYVPAPSTTLGVLYIGVGAPGSSIFSTVASATVTRGGPTQQLALAGNGLTANTTVSVSGTGVTLSGLQLVSGTILINIAVDSGATPGYRNVILTNAAGDTSIMTGGLLIQ
jgi:hypothetical protein